jgi:hypothetical protein
MMFIILICIITRLSEKRDTAEHKQGLAQTAVKFDRLRLSAYQGRYHGTKPKNQD